MNDHPDIDAAQVLERKALTNVRSLVDKVEEEDRNRTSKALRGTLILAPVLVAALAAVAYFVPSFRGKPPAAPPSQTVEEYSQRALARIGAWANGNRMQKENQGLAGAVELEFAVGPKGSVESIETRKSSWNSAVDGQATRLVKSAEPFEAVPRQLSAGPVRIAATVRFAQDAGGPTLVKLEPIALEQPGRR